MSIPVRFYMEDYIMAKFCGKCGSPLTNGMCPECDEKTLPMISPEDAEKHRKELEKQQRELRKEYEKQQEKEEKKEEKKIEKKIKKAEKKAAKKAERKAERKAKKKAKWKALTKKQKTTRIILKIVALLLSAFIIFSLVAGVLCYFNIVDIPFVNNILVSTGLKSVETNNTVAFTYEDYTFYSPNGAVYNITDPNDIYIAEITKDKDEFDSVSFAERNSVFHEDTIYTRNYDSKELYKFTVDEDGDFEPELWVDEEAFEDAGMSEYSACGFKNPVVCGDYVYFTYQQNQEFFVNEVDMEKGYGYNLCRISFDGEVEIFEDLYASDVVSDGKYIYFLDNGFVRNPDDFNENRIGLYRMKGNDDPEDAEQITDDLDVDIEGCKNAITSVTLEQMKLIDGTIYFLESYSSGPAKLKSISIDGDDLSEVIDEYVAYYDIDEKNDILYYAEGIRLDPNYKSYSVYSLSLDSYDKEFLFKTYSRITSINLHDGYLYIQNDAETGMLGENKKANIIGLRYNIEDEVMELMKGYYEGEMKEVLDPATGAWNLENNRGKSYIYWDDEKVDSDKIYTFTR